MKYYQLNSPLRVRVSSKKMFTLNLNTFRNAHHHELNKAKKVYKERMTTQIRELPNLGRVYLHYKLYPQTKRMTDIGNVVSVHKKFFEDALTELGVIQDDNYTIVVGSSESFGKLDKDNPRVLITIVEI